MITSLGLTPEESAASLVFLSASVDGSKEQRDREQEECKRAIPILPDVRIITGVFSVLDSSDNCNDNCNDERDNSQYIHDPANTPSAVFVLMSHTHDDVFVLSEIIRFFFINSV